jgi:hypothetical protein
MHDAERFSAKSAGSVERVFGPGARGYLYIKPEAVLSTSIDAAEKCLEF